MPTMTTPQSGLAEVRLHHDDFLSIMATMATFLDGAQGPIVCIFAAEGSAIPITFIPRTGLIGARPDARWPVGSNLDAQDMAALYVVRGGEHERCRAQWKSSAYWDLHTVQEWLCPNITDALPLYILLCELEVARGRRPRDEKLRREYRDTIMYVQRIRHGLGHDSLPPVWMDHYGTGGKDVSMSDVIASWFPPVE